MQSIVVPNVFLSMLSVVALHRWTVSDDGCGMSRDDALLSVERHATSKIAKAEDLETVETMGFRGEALASIAAISKFKLLTRNEDNAVASEIVVDGGKMRFAGDGAREKGTTIEVKQLFYNVPARRKFQKSPPASTTQIVRKMTDLALAHPDLQFDLWCDGKEKFKTSGQGFMQAALDLLGKGYLEQTKEIKTAHVKGVLGKPHASRSTRSGQYLFVNGRAVDCPLICTAITEGYGTRLGSHQHPIFALHMTFPSEWIDVNVHPQKREIRFYDEEKVATLVREAISSGFTSVKTEAIAPVTWDHNYEEMDFIAREEPQVQIPITRLPIVGLHSPYLILAAEHSPLKNTCKARSGFVLLHLKRAEERIFYNSMQQREKLECEMQNLMLPITLEYGHDQVFAVEKHMETFNQCGIGMRKFGEQTFVVDSLHIHIEPESVPLLIDRLLMAAGKEEADMFMQKVPKLIPRRALYFEHEAEMIVKELLKTEDVHTAPSGEPIFTHIDEGDIERLFKTS